MATLIQSASVNSSAFIASTLHTDSTNNLQTNSTPLLNAVHAFKPLQADNPKRRILLVDDDEDIRSLVRAFLQSDGHEVFSCGDGHRASELFHKRNDIDLLLTDLQMPGISGIVLADQLTALRPSLPVIIMSGMVLNEELQSIIASNRWRFLEKPFQVPKLLDTVHELLSVSLLSA
jgi:DNA-binding NtrC family response regulator